MSGKLKKAAVSFGLPRIIILSFLLVLVILLPVLGLQIDMLADQALTRIGMNGILVLAMVPAIESGVKMNFALPLGIVCGLLGGALSLEFGINGAGGFITAIVIAVPLAVFVGYLYGKVLNRIKGSEMMIATYVGFSAVSLMCIGWLVLPVKNPEIRWPQGHGLRTMTVLSGKYEKILDNFLAIRITEELSIPTGLFLFFFLACLLVWLFCRSHLGIMMKAGGANPSFARATGIDVDRTRILGMILSTVLGGRGDYCICSELWVLPILQCASYDGVFGSGIRFNRRCQRLSCHNFPRGIRRSDVPGDFDFYAADCQCDRAGW